MINHINTPPIKSLLFAFKFFRYIWRPFSLALSMQIILSFTMLYSIEALNIAISQVDPSKKIDEDGWMFRLLVESASNSSQVILNCALAALAIIFIGIVCEILVAWTISWSFALLSAKITPTIIEQLVYSDSAEAVKKLEATVVQRWLTIKQLAEFFHNVLANSLGAFFAIGVLVAGTYRENTMAGHSLLMILSVWIALLVILSPKALSTALRYAILEEYVGRNIRSSISLSDSLRCKAIFQSFLNKVLPNVTNYSKSITLQGFYGSLLYGVLSGIASLAPLVVIVVALLTNRDHTVGIATAAALYLFASKITSPLANLARIVPLLQSQRVDFSRLQTIYKNKSLEVQPEGKGYDIEIKSLHLDAFKYCYDKNREFHYSKFTIERGILTCISGISGAGKTTLLKVISSRLSGKVQLYVNGSISFEASQLADQIAFLPQEPKLAELSIKDNLELHASNRGITNSYCRQAYLKIIALLPENENTLVAADVIGLSVGQRRALCVINILSTNQPILILDEPLANIDDELSALLWLAIKEEAKYRIILVALHEEKYQSECDRVEFLTIWANTADSIVK